MGLILLPLTDGDTSIDSLGDVVEEFLEHLRTQDPLLPSGEEDSATPLSTRSMGRSLDRVQIVPWHSDGWQQDRWKKWEHRNVLRISEDKNIADRLGRFRKRIALALSHAIQLITHKRLRTNRIIIVPILPCLDNGYNEKNLQIFQQIQVQLDIVIREIFHQHLRLKDDHLDLPVEMSYYPWLFLKQPPNIEQLPSYLFRVPTSFQSDVTKQGTHTWLYTARSNLGEYRRWETYGSSRLLTDLYFFFAYLEVDILGTISNQASEYQRMQFLPYDPSIAHCFVMSHSAIFEFPLDDILRLNRLNHILEESSDHSSILPSIQDLHPLINHWKAESHVKSEVEDLLVSIKDKYEYPPQMPTTMRDKLAFGTHRDDPQFDTSLKKPNKGHWQQYVTDDWPILQPTLSIPKLFQDIYRALQIRSTENLDTQLDTELKQTRQTIETETKNIQMHIQNVLQATVSNMDKPPPKLEANIGKTFAYLQLILSNLESLDDAWAHSEENQDSPEPEEYLASLVEYQEKWLTREKELLEEGANLPSEGALSIELIALLATGLSIGAVIPIIFPISTPLTLLLSYFVVRTTIKRREKELEAYFEKWITFQQDIENEANDIAFSFGQKVLHRTFQLKIMLLEDLLSGIRSAERRFKVELHGFIRLVTDEQARLSNRFREMQEDLLELDSGRFIFAPQEGLEKISKYSDADGSIIESKIAEIFRESISIGSIPQVISLEKHEDVLLKLAQIAKPNLSSIEGEAREEYKKAQNFAFRDNIFYHGSQGKTEKENFNFQILGHKIYQRLNLSENDVHECQPVQIIAQGISRNKLPQDNGDPLELYLFPEEIAISYQLNRYRIDLTALAPTDKVGADQ